MTTNAAEDVPGFFHVLGYRVAVKVVEPSDWPGDTVGSCDYETGSILIKRRTPNLDVQVFWHEAIHFALHVLNSPHENDEMLVDTLAAAIAQILETSR